MTTPTDPRTEQIIELANTIATTADNTVRDNAYEQIAQLGRESAIEVWNGLSPNQEVKQ